MAAPEHHDDDDDATASMAMATSLKPTQCVQPSSGAAGRGAPVTSGFLIRSATAPWRELCATNATSAKTKHPSNAHHVASRSPSVLLSVAADRG